MKQIFLILCLFFISSGIVNAQINYNYAKDGFPPLQPKRHTVNKLARNNYNNLNYNKVTQAEKRILGQTYENQHIGVRLNRLERTVFNRTYPQMSYEQRMNNIIVNYRNNNVSNNLPLKNLSRLEKKIFKRTYDNDLPENRISRLEEQVMGTIQSGDLNSRYEMLSRAVPQYNKNTFTTVTPLNPYPYCGMPPTRVGSGWRGLAGSLGNFFNNRFVGVPTGMSPQIYSPYIPNYGPDFQRGSYGNTGWNYHNTWNGSGAGVHILP